MAESLTINDNPPFAELKQMLREEVSRFCRKDTTHWKQPIKETLDRLHKMHKPGVFFGGTLRSLLLRRLSKDWGWSRFRSIRPRDIDIVVMETNVDSLGRDFEDWLERRTRFGGLKLRNKAWEFDVWPLENTWALQHSDSCDASFEVLPETTFFNLEAIAVDIWVDQGRRSRRIYSVNDQFFEGIVNRTLEINFEENPYPELCVVRGLILAADIDFKLGSKFAQYVIRHGLQITPDRFQEIQASHYGRVRFSGSTICEWVISLAKEVELLGNDVSIELPKSEQIFVGEKETQTTQIHIRTMPAISSA